MNEPHFSDAPSEKHALAAPAPPAAPRGGQTSSGVACDEPLLGRVAAASRRQLGRSDIDVGLLGLGCWAIGGPLWQGEEAHGWGRVDDAQSIRAIHRALDLGVVLLDTADVYGAGHSESVLGRALEGRRQQVVIATKFGKTFNEFTHQLTGENASAHYVRQACEASLRRLRTDVIDLYQFHLNGHDPAHAAAVRETLEDLVQLGKIRHYGWSTDFPDGARVFAEGPHCAALQFQMNALDDAPAMVELCEQTGLLGINRGPLAMGLLTGKYRPGGQLGIDDVRGTKSPAWMKYFCDGRPNPRWLRRLEAVREILQLGGRTPVQGALAWFWARSPSVLPIPGFRTAAQVEENLGALRFGPLPPPAVTEIETLLGPDGEA